MKLHAEFLDCVQANLAVLADRFHGAGTYLRLGSVLRFRPRIGTAGLPTVDPLLDEHLMDARDLAGLEVQQRWSDVSGSTLAHLGACHGVLYVLADAYHLPWVPYHQQRHLMHSFLIEVTEACVTISDAYHNETPWGPAKPGRWELTPGELERALPDGGEAIRLAPGPLTALTPVVDHQADIDGYLAAYADHPDRALALDELALQTWLMARSRKLHAAYRSLRIEADAHLLRWDRVVEQSYLAARRVARGRAEPPGLMSAIAELLTIDREVFTPVGGPNGDLQVTVTRVVSDILQISQALDATTDLTRFPTFSSFRMIEIIEQMERLFETELLADDLIPERMHRVQDLCEVVRRARRHAGVALKAKEFSSVPHCCCTICSTRLLAGGRIGRRCPQAPVPWNSWGTRHCEQAGRRLSGHPRHCLRPARCGG